MGSVPILAFTPQSKFWLAFGTLQVLVLDTVYSWIQGAGAVLEGTMNDEIFCSIIHTTGAGSVWDQGSN